MIRPGVVRALVVSGWLAGVLIGCRSASDPGPVPSAGTRIPAPNADLVHPQALVVNPAVLPFTADELANPSRGLYRWSGQLAVNDPALISSRDSYDRFRWEDLESGPGEYDFSEIDAFIQDSQNNGELAQLGLVQPMGPASNGGSRMPGYLTKNEYGTWWNGSFWPDFNHPYVIERFEALLEALGERYNRDERITMVQMIGYGAYGEYYVPSDAPDRVSRITQGSAQRMVAAYRQAFPDKHLLTMISNSQGSILTRTALLTDPSIGWSRAALGCDEQMDNVDALMQDPEVGPTLRNRWKYAPVWTEMIGQYSGDCGDRFATTLAQVRRYHVSLVGNGNFREPFNIFPFNADGSRNPDSNWRQQDIDAIVAAGKHSGYRYAIGTLELGPTIIGQPWQVRTQWRNDGVAPTYDSWQVEYQLRDDTGAVVWSARSQTDLRKVLPPDSTTGNQHHTVDDLFTLPNDLPSATYRLFVLVPAFNRYIEAMQLAHEPRQRDGSYYLADVPVYDAEGNAPAALPAFSSVPTSVAPLPSFEPLATPTAVAITADGAGIRFVGQSAIVQQRTATVKLARPESTRPGDLLLAQIVTRSPEATVIAPAGWTLVRSDAYQNAVRQTLYSRIVAEDETSAYVWESDTQNTMGGGIVAYRGVDPARPVLQHAGKTDDADRVRISRPDGKATSRLVAFGSVAWGYANMREPDGTDVRYETRKQRTDLTLIAADGPFSALADRITLRTSDKSGFVGQVVLLAQLDE